MPLYYDRYCIEELTIGISGTFQSLISQLAVQQKFVNAEFDIFTKPNFLSSAKNK